MGNTVRPMEIESHGTFLNYLVKDVRNGLLVPAAFQRPYVWTQDDVLSLITSIQRRFPIGSFLQWSPWGAADMSGLGRRRLGPIEGKSDTGTHVPSLLLDGQNRLASLAWMMRNPGDPLPADLVGQEKETWGSGEQLILELAERTIKFVPESEVNVGFRLPMSTLFHGSLNQEMRDREKTQWAGWSLDDIDNSAVWVDEVRYAFQEARVVVTDIQYATLEQAKEAFMHICKVGVQMSEADFDAATKWALPKA